MAVIHRANKKLRKEVVIPFDGEHNFIVPKYVNAAGKPIPIGDEPLVPQAPTGGTYTSTSTNTPTKTPVISPTLSTPAPAVLVPQTITPIIAVPTMTPVEYAQGEIAIAPSTYSGGGRAPLAPIIESPSETPSSSGTTIYNAANYFPVKNYVGMSCDSLKSYLNELNNVDSSSFGGMYASKAQGDYNALLTSVRNATGTACRVISTVIEGKNDALEFPNVAIMNCTQLATEIARLKSMAGTANLPSSTKILYDEQILNAENTYISKSCNVVTPIDTSTTNTSSTNTNTPNTNTPTEVTSTTTITPPFSPVFGGGGGGGGAIGDEPPPTETSIETSQTVKKDYSWLWILAVVGGLYFLTRKKK